MQALALVFHCFSTLVNQLPHADNPDELMNLHSAMAHGAANGK
jgi:hypothetical protein